MRCTLERGVRHSVFAGNLDWRKTSRIRYLLSLSDKFQATDDGKYFCIRGSDAPIAFVFPEEVGFCYPRPRDGISERTYKATHNRLRKFYRETINA